MEKPRLLVLGAGGQIGRETVLAATGEFGVAARTRRELDITDIDALSDAIGRLRPTTIINCAAYTAVDRAESEREAAFAINATAPARLAALCADFGATLIHLSTDYVFDGAKAAPYVEDDPTGPLNVYGASKLAGEQALAASMARHVILRTSWIYAAHGHNFVRTMLGLAGERDVVRVVDDQQGAPTAAADVAAALLEVARVAASGARPLERLYHFTARGATSWYGFAEEIFAAAAVKGLGVPHLQRVASGANPTAARRPANSRLDCTRFDRTFSVPRPDWRARVAPIVAALLAATPTGAGQQ